MRLTSKDVAQYWWDYDFAYEVLSSYHKGDDWLNKTVAENYLKKYGLFDDKDEDWKAVKEMQEAVFYLDRRLPDMIFKKDFEYIGLLGGGIFEEKDFNQFKSCLDKIGEKTFVVVQNPLGFESEAISKMLEMKYPADISWEELMSGNYISTIFFEGFDCHFYVFGKNEEWGMYVANDGYSSDHFSGELNYPSGRPVNIMGFSLKYRDIFREGFEIPDGQYYENLDYIPEEERPNLKELVPPLYRS